ncbi:MAG: hypothetical protein IKC71_00180 [Clostridia bacterium]|nr:hypothetical protein [Clostridia bacterium]
MVLSKVNSRVNASFQYLYHGLIFLNAGKIEEGRFLLDLSLKALKVATENEKGKKLILTKNFNLYSLRKGDFKKMLLDDIVEETLYLTKTKKEDSDLNKLKTFLQRA